MYREGRVGYIYVSAWGFFVVRSDELGNARAFRLWNGQQAMFSTSFLYMDVSIIIKFQKS